MTPQTKHLDLGQRNGPMIIFGGPYANLQATEALLAEAVRLGLGGSDMICTGDVVAYCADAEATAQRVRQSGMAVVAGNCEIQLATWAANCGCGFEDGSACDLLSVGWYGHANKAISDAARAWMGEVPDILTFDHHGARYAVIHGGMTDVARFVWDVSPPEVFAEEWDAVTAAVGPVDHIIAGHCGIPFIRATPRGQWINAGVIGMPPNDGRQQTRYAILDGGEVRIHRLNYDVEAAHAAMQAAGLTHGYDSALRSGYWPSEDVLPPVLRASALARG